MVFTPLLQGISLMWEIVTLASAFCNETRYTSTVIWQSWLANVQDEVRIDQILSANLTVHWYIQIYPNLTLFSSNKNSYKINRRHLSLGRELTVIVNESGIWLQGVVQTFDN